MIRTRHRLAVVALVALTAAACGDDDNPALDASPPTIGGDDAAGRDVTIVGENVTFDIDSLDVTAGETVTFTFDNRDDGIEHNLHVQGLPGGDAKTEIESGPVTQTLEVTFDEAGEFRFFCDVHPDQMRGTITVTP